MPIYARTLAAALCLAAFNMEAVPAQTPVAGCSTVKSRYSCEKAGEDLARELGKSVQPGSADLTF